MEIGIKHQNANFNPRPREEGDVAHTGTVSDVGNFNPRPREEGDNTALLQARSLKHFNPRPREEGDQFSQRHGII